MRNSWDRWVSTDAESDWTLGHESLNYAQQARVVPWPEDCPYPPEEVPQVGEVVNGKTVLTTPYQGYRDEWFVQVRHHDLISGIRSRHLRVIVSEYNQSKGPTISIGDKDYLVSDVEKALSGVKPV